MTTSGTTNFNPAFGELMLDAFNIAGLRPASLLQEHFESARMAANLMLGRWSADGVNLWQVDLVTIPLVAGTATYAVDPTTIVMLDAYMTITDGNVPNNRILLPISRTEYASYPNPQQPGVPTVFWFDRLLSPSVTLWPVPDGNEVSFSYYRVKQNQDTNLQGGLTVNIPNYFLEAFVYGLAYRLAARWNPNIAVALKALADESYGVASRQNIETAQTYVLPQLAGYYR